MKFLFSICLFLVFFISAYGQTEDSTYRNNKYAFGVDYPGKHLKLSSHSDVGATFVSQDDQTRIFVYASLNVNDLDSVSAQRTVRTDIRMPTSTEFIQTGTIASQVSFQRTVRHIFPKADIYYNVIAKYPKSQRKKWAPIVKRLADSFHFNAEADVTP